MRLLQLKNIYLMFVTFEVLKFDKFNVVRLLQLENIELMFVTFEVLKFDTSKEESTVQP
nr:hypothetical protein [Prevotella sp.]